MKEALKLALEALQLVSIEFVCNGAHHAKKDRHDWLESCPIVERYQAAITAIKEALAQDELCPSQEPVAWEQFYPDIGKPQLGQEPNNISTEELIYMTGVYDGKVLEREACAKVAQETICDTHIPTGINIYGTRAAKAIRARGNT